MSKWNVLGYNGWNTPSGEYTKRKNIWSEPPAEKKRENAWNLNPEGNPRKGWNSMSPIEEGKSNSISPLIECFDALCIQRPSSKFPIQTIETPRVSAGRKCGFCFRNGEADNIFECHSLRGKNGIVTCPVLRKYVCPICKATGDTAHTITYCPEIKSLNDGHNPASTALILKSSKVKSSGKKRY